MIRIKLTLEESLFLFGLALQPFVYWPWATISYEVPKVWITIFWIMALGVGSIFSTNDMEKSSFRMDKGILLLVIGYFILCLMASFFGVDFAKSMIGNPYRVDGLVTLSALVAFGVLSTQILQQKLNIPLSKCIAFSSTVLSLWAVSNFLLFHLFSQMWIENWDGAIGLTFGQPNFLAGYLLVTLPFHWFIFQTNRSSLVRKLSLFGLVIQSCAIVTTYSWGAAMGVFLFITFLASRKHTKHRSIIWPAITLICIIIFFSVSLWKDASTFVPESRYRIYTNVWQGFMQRPLLGWGVANVDQAFALTAYKEGFLHEIYLDKAHSEWLEILTTTGIFGGLIYGVLLVFMWKKLSFNTNDTHLWKQTLGIAFLLYLFHSQTNVISISQQLIFWLIVSECLKRQTTTER